jgi:hypothetical protein
MIDRASLYLARGKSNRCDDFKYVYLCKLVFQPNRCSSRFGLNHVREKGGGCSKTAGFTVLIENRRPVQSLTNDFRPFVAIRNARKFEVFHSPQFVAEEKRDFGTSPALEGSVQHDSMRFTTQWNLSNTGP